MHLSNVGSEYDVFIVKYLILLGIIRETGFVIENVMKMT